MFSNLKQRVLNVGHKEPEEFKQRRKQCFAMKDDLQKAEKSIKVWLEGCKKLSDAGKQLAELAAAGDTDLMKIGSEISVEFGQERMEKACREAMDSIGLKVKLIDKLKKQVGELEERRLSKERFKRKLDDAEKKDDEQKKELLRQEYEQARLSHADLNAEVEGNFDFFIEESKGHGGFGLAKAEMDLFKKTASAVFQACNQICQNVLSSSLISDIDISAEWRNFNNRLDEKVNARKQQIDSSPSPIGTDQSAPPPPPPGAAALAGDGSQYGSQFDSQYGSQYGSQTDIAAAASSATSAPPPPPPPPPSAAAPTPQAYPQARALYDYAPQAEDELAIKAGDVISVFSQEDDGWWQGTLPNGQKGMFPSNYVELLDQGNIDAGNDEDDDSYGAV